MDLKQSAVNEHRQYGSGYYQHQGYQQGRHPAGQQPPEQMFAQQNPSMPGIRQPTYTARGLSREERLEAQRLMEEANFGFEGYQVVRREFMSHQFDPAMTIRGNSITFNNACISKLEDATYIQFLINPTQMKMVIRACSEGARDAVRWCITKDDKRKSRQITCGIFTAKLYEMMNWEPMYRYKLQGMRITYNGEVLYLFDLNANEAFLPQVRDPETGRMKRAKPVLPPEWRDSFGMSVAEHAASLQINLQEGYVEAGRSAPEEKDGALLEARQVEQMTIYGEGYE